MSKENVKLFMEKMQTSEELQEKVKELYSKNRTSFQEGIIKLGTESGCEFSAEDLQQLAEIKAEALHQHGELDDSQLENVAGGYGNLWHSILMFGTDCDE